MVRKTLFTIYFMGYYNTHMRMRNAKLNLQNFVTDPKIMKSYYTDAQNIPKVRYSGVVWNDAGVRR